VASPEQLIVRPVRRDDLAEAAQVAEVLNSVIVEGQYTAMAGHWTPEAEQAYFQSLGLRSEVMVAVVSPADDPGEERIVGFQSLEPFVKYTTTMDHVCHVGTFVHADFRGRGIGRRLAEATLALARAEGYLKCVVYVLAHNEGGLGFYRSLGFEVRGSLLRQTKLGDRYCDEVFMELHFD
jgi:ribosomal protein S18 acetylase RimI-like enzyme